MCPPLPLNSDGTLNAAAASYVTNRPQVGCQTLRLPIDEPSQSTTRILATSGSEDGAGPLSPRGTKKSKARRLPHEYVAASLPEAPSLAKFTAERSHNHCPTNISELYRQCRHHEVKAGGVSCRNVIMEYLQCTAGDR